MAGLVDVGWLEHQANGEVRIGLRLWELVNRNSAVLGLRPTCGATTTASMPPSCAGTWPASGRLGAGRPVADRPVAALGVVVAAGEENIPAIVPALMTAARGLARAVGQVVPGTGRWT